MAEADGRPAPADAAVVGTVVRAHALRGEVVVEPADPAAGFDVDRELWVGGRWRRVVGSRPNRGRWLLELEGIDDRNAAEALRGAELLVEAESLPPLDEDRYYVHDLVGCRVETPAGEVLGTVLAVVDGPQSWLEIEQEGSRILVPMARALLREVDTEGRRIVIDPPAGLAEATRA